MTSLRKLTLTSTMAVLILVTLFPSCVKADVQLSQEFVKPKNRSFEERGASVYACPPWESNNGGWRELRGDCYPDEKGNGKCNYEDLFALANAYGSEPGRPNWKPYCDLDGDVRVDSDDLFILADDYNKEANRIDGHYSWYTSGGGDYQDYQMWQNLTTEALSAVRGKDVVFSYWFLPDFPSHSVIDTERDGNILLSYVLVSTLFISPVIPALHLTKVQFDAYGYRGGYYAITYQRCGEAEVDIVRGIGITNKEYETKQHTCDVWGNKGQGIYIRFYTRCAVDDVNTIFSKNYCAYYSVSVPARAGIYWTTGSTSQIVWGDYVEGDTSEWRDVLAVASIPSTATAVKVIIHGNPDFKAWIDQTSLSITETSLVEKPDRKLSLSVNLFESKDYGLPIDPCRAFLAISMSADDTHGGVWIQYTELKITLIAGSFVRIKNVTQSNDEDYVTDPDQTEEIENTQIVAAKIAIGGTTTAALFFIAPGLGIHTIGKLMLSIVTGQGVSLLMSTWRSDADTPYIDELGGYAKARIGYGKSFPDWVNERCKVELGFELGSNCQVEVTAKAEYWTTVYAGYIPVPIPYETLQTSILVTVSL